MNEINLSILNSMKKLQYYDFLRYALGMKYYLQNDGQEIITNLDEKDEGQLAVSSYKKKNENKDRIIAYLYSSKKRTGCFLTTKNDYMERTFHDDQGELYNARSYFDNVGDNILWNIMIGVIGVENYHLYKNQADASSWKSLYEKNKPEIFRIILGAGINSGYNLGNWNNLIDSIRAEIRRMKKIPSCPNPKDSLLRLEEAMSNTNYIAPQILKDLDSNVYHTTIYDSLYSNFNVRKTSLNYDKTIEDTTLYQVARIVANQGADSHVLTFNYDNVLELVLENNFPIKTESVYYKCKKKDDASVHIIHSHGYFPYSPDKVIDPHAIVFSSYEYMNGYLNSGSFARRKLTEQIEKTNILIGNSLSDYEEQKVFFLHHKKYPSHFSYLFTTKSSDDDSWMDDYKTIYFLKLGVIPVFFDDYPAMINYLKTI